MKAIGQAPRSTYIGAGSETGGTASGVVSGSGSGVIGGITSGSEPGRGSGSGFGSGSVPGTGGGGGVLLVSMNIAENPAALNLFNEAIEAIAGHTGPSAVHQGAASVHSSETRRGDSLELRI